MPNKNQKRFEWSTRQEKVIINSFCSPDEIASLLFVEAYTKYARYRSIVSKKETLIKAASQPDTNVTLAFRHLGIPPSRGTLAKGRGSDHDGGLRHRGRQAMAIPQHIQKDSPVPC